MAQIRATRQASLRGLAAELNARGIRTRRGGRRQLIAVRNLLALLAN